jgi:DNA-binding MarR family transcriptional regulator
MAPNKRAPAPTPAKVIARDCIAVRVRALGRAITALYDDALRPHGLRVGQLNLLVAIARIGTARPGDLCRVLRMEKSTLSRDVELMRRNGWITVDASGGGRARPLQLTPAGQAILEDALPAWRAAQARARALIGDDGIAALARAFDGLRRDDDARA